MLFRSRNNDRADGDTGDAGGVFTRLLHIFTRRAVEPSPRVCKPRIYGPGSLDDEDVVLGFPDGGTDVFQMRSELLTTIQNCYQQWVKVFGNAATGLCFGLLDPLSNIVVNTLIDKAVVVEEDDGDAGDDQTASTSSLWHGLPDKNQGGGDMNRNERSLDGLLALLAGLFPHLSDVQAVWYLHKAKADPLVAARIIIKHRRMDNSFRFSSDAAVETALGLAAVSALHPNPMRFIAGWRVLSPNLKELATLLSRSAPDATADLLASIVTLLEEPAHAPVCDLDASWDLASSRLAALSLPDLTLRGVVFPGRTTMRRMLLTTIHGYYLQALARLPKDQLCSHHLLYSMLHYGHCFGPLDPVSNILLNTISWYSSACPIEDSKVDMISTNALLRIAVRSFYGLVSFLCTRYDALTVDRAMNDLLEAGADLRIADPNFHGNKHAAAGRVPSASVQEAYAAAAAAAHHPKPQAQVVLLGQSPLLLQMGSVYLNGSGSLSCDVVCQLSSTAQKDLSSTYSPDRLVPETKVLDKLTYKRVDQQRKNFWNQHARVVGMVKSAMEMYNCQPGVPEYELHVICGVNERVHGPEYIGDGKQIYHLSHINFLTTCKDSHSAGALPVLFFAQWSNNGAKEECLVCPVGVPPLNNSEQARCLYCEYEGSRIVHPANKSFHGRGIEIVKIVCGGLYSGKYTNDDIIEHSCSSAFWVDYVEDDSIYSNYRIEDDAKEDGPIDFHRLIRLS